MTFKEYLSEGRLHASNAKTGKPRVTGGTKSFLITAGVGNRDGEYRISVEPRERGGNPIPAALDYLKDEGLKVINQVLRDNGLKGNAKFLGGYSQFVLAIPGKDLDNDLAMSIVNDLEDALE